MPNLLFGARPISIPMNEDYKEEYREEGEEEIFEEDLDQPLSPVNTIDKNQKIIAGFLAFFALAILFLWSAQFKQNLISPLDYSKEAEKEASSEEDGTCTGTECEENYQLSLRTKDTDRDGLTDWDELNVYKTSPYLDDSDSDGYSDGEEIASGGDPNCPQGVGCDLLDEEFVVDNGVSAEEVFTDSFEQIDSLDSSTGDPDQAIIDLLEGRSDPALLRQVLIDSGMEEEMVDKISDEALINTYKEVLNATK